MNRKILMMALAMAAPAAHAATPKAGAKPAVKTPVAKPGAAPAATAPTEDIPSLRSEIHEPSEPKAIEAARKLAEDTSPQAVDAILDELAVGAPPKVQVELLAGLAGRKDPRALDVLSHYAQNRNVSLRKKAIVAIGEINDPRVAPVLVAALSDGVEDVRAAGARALSARKDRSPLTEDALVKLLAHKDNAAMAALGSLGGPTTARRLGELFGQIPDALLAGTFAELLQRDDFGPDPLRLEVVKAVGKLTGPEATQTLHSYISGTDKDKARPSRLEAQKLIEQRGAQQ